MKTKKDNQFTNLQEQIKKHYSEVYDGSMDFMNSLNQFKKQAMKINGETQLKDLIPEGYESSGNACMSLCIGEEHIIISIKKKEVKDFKWYVGEYMNAAYFNIKYKVHGNICDSFRSENFDKVPFEFKIGLLKFICDDLGVPFRLYLSGEYAESPKYETEIRELKSICPQEFLNSIFE